jgi:hypothetical protein
MSLKMPVCTGTAADLAITPDYPACNSIRAEPVHIINSMTINQGS